MEVFNQPTFEDGEMSLKTTIKNDLWRVNYIVPFIKKHQFDEKGKAGMLKHVLRAYRTIKPVKAKGTRSVGADTKAVLSCIDIELRDKSRFVYFLDTSKTIAVSGNILSNFTLAYDKIVHGSFSSLAEKASGEDDYGKEAQLVADGVENLASRIVDELRKSSHSNKEKLIHYFSRMLTTPAEHFDEGLQRILFFNQIMWQTRHRLNGLGRLDQMLGDLYEKDKMAGILTESEAHKIVYDFLANLSFYQNYKSDALEGDIGQIVILGGLDSDGSYFSNELTTIFLEEQARLGKPDPKTFLRVSKDMPEKLLRTAVECLSAKTGSPLFSNDDVVIPALLDFGVDGDDAYSYCVSACWEPLIVGKSLAQNNIAVFDYFPAFDEVMTSGANSFDELVEKYITVNQQKFQEFLKGIDAMKWAKDPLVSMFTDGASKKRVDISDGSCKYRSYGITTVALSNVVDSLLNVQDLVYKQKKYTLAELNDKREANYENDEVLYRELTNAVKHYGHDEDEVAVLVNRIGESLSKIAKDYRNPMGGTVKFGLSSPGYNILSKKTSADVSGRKAGMPYNTHISCLDAGYTEVVDFAGKLDYNNQRFNGNVVDFFASPSFIEQNIDKFTAFMVGAIKTGFFQMQMNVLDSKTLVDAKVHPENYKGLIVRVWGFSAYFNELPESYKDLLIERAIAAKKVA